jgi:hypothetical protein
MLSQIPRMKLVKLNSLKSIHHSNVKLNLKEVSYAKSTFVRRNCGIHNLLGDIKKEYEDGSNLS